MKKVLNNMNRPLLIVTSILLCFGLIMILISILIKNNFIHIETPSIVYYNDNILVIKSQYYTFNKIQMIFLKKKILRK